MGQLLFVTVLHSHGEASVYLSRIEEQAWEVVRLWVDVRVALFSDPEFFSDPENDDLCIKEYFDLSDDESFEVYQRPVFDINDEIVL